MIHSYLMPYPLQSFHALVTLWNYRSDMVRRTTRGLWGMVTACWTNPHYRDLRLQLGYVKADAFGPPPPPPSIKIHFWSLDISTMPEQFTCGWVTFRVYPRVCTIFSVWQVLFSHFQPLVFRTSLGRGCWTCLSWRHGLRDLCVEGRRSIKTGLNPLALELDI